MFACSTQFGTVEEEGPDVEFCRIALPTMIRMRGKSCRMLASPSATLSALCVSLGMMITVVTSSMLIVAVCKSGGWSFPADAAARDSGGST